MLYKCGDHFFRLGIVCLFFCFHILQKRCLRLVQHGKTGGLQQENAAFVTQLREDRFGSLVADGNALGAATVVDNCLYEAVQCLLENICVVL